MFGVDNVGVVSGQRQRKGTEPATLGRGLFPGEPLPTAPVNSPKIKMGLTLQTKERRLLSASGTRLATNEA